MMKLLICLLLIARSNGVFNNTRRFMEQMSTFLTKLCPGSNICRSDDSVVAEGRVSETGALGSLYGIVGLDYGAFGSESMMRSCCTDCSCKSECVETNDCCFASTTELPNCTNSDSLPSKDMTVLADRNGQCIYPTTGDFKPSDATKFRSYYIISSENACYTANHEEDCGNQKVATWGSLYPVFSKRTGKVYKNKVCANAHNITDAIFWDATLACRKFNSDTLRVNEISSFFGDLERGVVSSQCHVQFSYPGDQNDVNSQVCYRDMIDQCTSMEFQVPLYLNATKDEISDACQSGLLSPYYTAELLYANVFCYICSGLAFDANDKCPDKNAPKDEYETIDTKEFLALLTAEISEKIDVHNKKQIPMACPIDKHQHVCRPVMCSSGKIRNSMGDCIFPSKVWYRQHYTVAFELTSEREIDIKEAFQFENEQSHALDVDALYLSTTYEFNPWTVSHVFYKTKTQLSYDTTTNNLVVFMNQYLSEPEPEIIMYHVAVLMKAKWFLKYKTEILSLDPSPFKHKLLNYFDNLSTPGSLTVNSTLSVKSPDYRHIYSPKHVLQRGFLVTKLYFCEQIELVSEEYMLSADQSILFNKINHQFLFDGEFSLTYGGSEGSVRICNENSGFVKTTIVNCACAKSHSIADFVLLVVISWALAGV